MTDFGLARSLTGHTPWTAEVEGTAPFMAPEQASRSWGEIDVRTDVYGIGAVFYTLVTGRPPWVGRRLPDVLANVISAAVVIPPVNLRPDMPSGLSDLCRSVCPRRKRIAIRRCTTFVWLWPRWSVRIEGRSVHH